MRRQRSLALTPQSGELIAPAQTSTVASYADFPSPQIFVSSHGCRDSCLLGRSGFDPSIQQPIGFHVVEQLDQVNGLHQISVAELLEATKHFLDIVNRRGHDDLRASC